MASVSNMQLSIVKDVANAEITLDYDIMFSSFDQLTNLSYLESWKLIGDDTGQDGDDQAAGDDPINLGLMLLSTVSSNGQASLHRTKTRTIAWSNLNEDVTAPAAPDDEIRAVVTLQPSLPVTTSRESAQVNVTV